MGTKRKIYLYIKISPKGLFYLGVFIERINEKYPLTVERYKGSGLVWKKHLRKHKISWKEIQTIILHETYDSKEIKILGLYYSRLFNIVESDKWANLIDENGEGCVNVQDPLIIEKRTSKLRGKKYEELICPHCKTIGRGVNMNRYHFDNCPQLTGKPVDEVVECTHCFEKGSKNNMVRWHFNNCPNITGKKREGRPHYEETKNKIRIANTGKRLSEESMRKNAEARKKPVIQMDEYLNKIKEWNSAADASRELGLNGGNITNACKGRSTHSGGFKWRYK